MRDLLLFAVTLRDIIGISFRKRKSVTNDLSFRLHSEILLPFSFCVFFFLHLSFGNIEVSKWNAVKSLEKFSTLKFHDKCV